MTTWHTHDSFTSQNASGRMVTLCRKRWVDQRVQDLTLESDISDEEAKIQSEKDWIEFTNCPF